MPILLLFVSATLSDLAYCLPQKYESESKICNTETNDIQSEASVNDEAARSCNLHAITNLES